MNMHPTYNAPPPGTQARMALIGHLLEWALGGQTRRPDMNAGLRDAWSGWMRFELEETPLGDRVWHGHPTPKGRVWAEWLLAKSQHRDTPGLALVSTIWHCGWRPGFDVPSAFEELNRHTSVPGRVGDGWIRTAHWTRWLESAARRLGWDGESVGVRLSDEADRLWRWLNQDVVRNAMDYDPFCHLEFWDG